MGLRKSNERKKEKLQILDKALNLKIVYIPE